MNHKHLLIFPLFLGTCFAAHADKVSMQAAKQKADAFWNKTIGRKAQLKAAGQTENYQPYYVFNDKEKGFVIISGDDAAPSVLAFSAENTFSADSLPDGLQALLKSYEQQIRQLQSRQARPKPLRYSRNEVHLETAEWDQTGVFSQSTPMRAPTGCVATALSIIMKYHGYPVQPKGRTIYYSNYAGRYLQVDYSKSSYDFDAMPMKQTSGTQAADFKKVAKLMYDVGLSVEMSYGNNESSAVQASIPKAMRTYFCYSPQVQLRFASNYTNDEWLDMIRWELDNLRPVLYMGEEISGGHAYVVDGYKDNLFSVNWGWGGQDNGYYTLGSVIEEGDNTKYNLNASALFFLQPLEEGERHNLEVETEAGMLSDNYNGSDSKCVDTLTVRGQINMDDFNAIKNFGVRNLNLSDVQTVANNSYFADNTIFPMAFYAMKEVWSIVCPGTVTSIEYDAFRANEDLSSVVLPASLTSISDNAFKGCSRLLNLTVLANTPPVLGRSVFENSPVTSQGTLHVPAGRKSAYSLAEGWKDFKKILDDADGSVYTGIGTPLANTATGEPRYALDGNRLTVKTSSPVRLYDAGGRLVSTDTSVVLGAGTYLLEVNGTVEKIIVR